ncbi:MAG: DUF3179 domain-containing protein [Acetobacteraceae bacterium]|nr:DUF3179 domain-containing protein [Acetobacteraceae bacterium]
MPALRPGRRAALALLPVTALAPAALAQPAAGSDPAVVAEALFAVLEETRIAAAQWFAARGNPDAVPVLIRALHLNRHGAPHAAVQAALLRLTGTTRPDWFAWMQWLQANPQLGVIPGHDRFLQRYFSWFDPGFPVFIHASVAHRIRLEEVVWGGVGVDSIPALDNPPFAPAGAPPWTRPDDLVFGIEINGDARAYPLRILDWHEMFNDVIGGVPVALAYCTLCGSGILFETLLPGREQPFVFGSSGLLWRSNKLMFDRATNSLWNQFTGEPVVGPLANSGIRLRPRPVVITTWAAWRATHPATRLLSRETGHARDYSPGAAYREYFASPDLMFPALTDDRRLAPKDYVFALRGASVDKAWPLSLFAGGRVLNDVAGVLDIVLIGDAATRSVRAYRRDGLEFRAGGAPDRVVAGGQSWRVTEAALVAPNGRSLDRLPGHVAYWFAWAGYLGGQGELAGGR